MERTTAESPRQRVSSNSPAYRRAILALFCGGLAAFGIEYCVQPIIPVFTAEFGISPAMASLSVSCGIGGMAIAMLLIASMAKRLPRRKIMAGSLLLSAVLAIFMAFSPGYELILGLRLIQGMLLAGFPAMAIAYINEEFDVGIIGSVVGIYVSGTSIGGLVGRMLLSFLTDFFSWRMALGILGLLYALIALAMLLLLPKTQHPVNPHAAIAGWHEFHRLLLNRSLVALYMVALIVMGTFVCTYNFISYILLNPPYNLSQTTVGFVYLLYFLGTISSTVMGHMADRRGNGKVMLLSIVFMILGLLLSLLEPLSLKLIGIGALTYGFFGAHSSACSWAGRLDKSDKARISAMYMFFYYVGGSIVGTAGGFFLALHGWDGIVGFLCALLSLAGLIGIWLWKDTQKAS